MVKSQKILKEEQASKRKTKTLTKKKEETKTSVEERARLLEQWHEEIQSLKNRKFSTIEEAVSVIAANVVKKLELNDSRAEETRLFIEDILLSDPTISEQLRNLLKINT